MHSAVRRFVGSTAVLLLAASVASQTTTPAPTHATTSAPTPSITAVSDCHPHSTVLWCMAGTEEYQIVGPTKTEEFEAQYTGCHAHGTDVYCLDPDGEEVQVLIEPEDEDEHNHTEEDPHAGEGHCHFHAGVEHCVGGAEQTCERVDRDYNIPLRVGLLFVILFTSALGVFVPIIATTFTRMSMNNIIFVILKQFGTGVVLSTAFIHLFTHAHLMFTNDCLGELSYEGTTAAILMAGLFLSFLVDYIGARFLAWRQSRARPAEPDNSISHTSTPTPSESERKSGNVTPAPATALTHSDHHGPHVHGSTDGSPVDEKLSVTVLEAGIVFHSLLIGLTLVVAGDSFFLTLFAVILFHQMFEGIALGTCIAAIPSAKAGTLRKLIMGTIFALITPIGMAIGIGVLNHFNGNDPSTLIAIGTLDAFSAGILVWVGVVEMLARDWLHGPLLNAGLVRTVVAMFALICGMILMSVLGKWA
ncbi:Zip-domain-containing protein [Aaosphaeria arxii CBS 175.79]|uniref:Zip-domain-containing protein n=1 Tax=Aaosphaeria arxii CBS 175.79 TaxID=1450172 RepID=A0A6A5XNM0_9PLEO|nr:Zip-domain-containing protein [Aaosphaeria arxii CBS 175.79]KAF2014533.1 Zip-domain-containing protein [Aaosphaeria arxii CBS 175.79]